MTASFRVLTTIGPEGLATTNVTAHGLTNGIPTPRQHDITIPNNKILGRIHNRLIEG